MLSFEFIDRNNAKAKRSTNYLLKEGQKQISSEPETFEFWSDGKFKYYVVYLEQIQLVILTNVILFHSRKKTNLGRCWPEFWRMSGKII